MTSKPPSGTALRCVTGNGTGSEEGPTLIRQFVSTGGSKFRERVDQNFVVIYRRGAIPPDRGPFCRAHAPSPAPRPCRCRRARGLREDQGSSRLETAVRRAFLRKASFAVSRPSLALGRLAALSGAVRDACQILPPPFPPVPEPEDSMPARPPRVPAACRGRTLPPSMAQAGILASTLPTPAETALIRDLGLSIQGIRRR